MLRNKTYVKKLTVHPWGSQLWIVVSNSISRSIDTIEDLIDVRVVESSSQYQAYTYAYEMPQGGYRMMLFVAGNCSISDIVHEANHIKNLLFLWHGVKRSKANDETESYLLGWICEQVDKAKAQYERRLK